MSGLCSSKSSVARKKVTAGRQDCKSNLSLAFLQTSFYVEVLLIKTSHESEQGSRRSVFRHFALGRRYLSAREQPDVQRTGPYSADGVEFLEQVRLQRQRRYDQGHGRRPGQVRHERRRLPVRQHRRLLASQSRL